MTDYLLLPLTFMFTFLGCRLIMTLSHRNQWLDRPNSRSSHSRPTPTGGGLAIVVVFSLAVVANFADAGPGFNHYVVLLAALAVAGIGLADDIFSLDIWPRISVQGIVVVIALALFGLPVLPVFGLELEPGLAGYLLALLMFLWFINLFNFMDGIDGLAGAEALFICLSALFLVSPGDNAGFTEFLLLLIAAVSGFLLLNLAPARIFMGDVGSNFLGYLLGILALSSTANGATTLWTWLILGGVFIVDATCTLFGRILNGEKWYYAHRSHAYQRAAVYFRSHGKVVMLITLINCGWILPMAWLSGVYPGLGLTLLLVAWLPLVLLVRIMTKLQAAN